MRTLGRVLLAVAILLALPMLLHLVRPMWWHDWFGNPTSAPHPRDLAMAISYAQLAVRYAIFIGLVGLGLVIHGSSSGGNK